MTAPPRSNTEHDTARSTHSQGHTAHGPGKRPWLQLLLSLDCRTTATVYSINLVVIAQCAGGLEEKGSTAQMGH